MRAAWAVTITWAFTVTIASVILHGRHPDEKFLWVFLFITVLVGIGFALGVLWCWIRNDVRGFLLEYLNRYIRKP